MAQDEKEPKNKPITVQGDEVKLRPQRSSSPLRKKQGVWVFSTGETISSDETAEALRDLREQRDLD